MSKISKYFQATSQLLLCYEYDKGSTKTETRSCICYQNLKGQPVLLMTGQNKYHDNLFFTKFDDPRDQSGSLIGYTRELDDINYEDSKAFLDYLYYGGKLSRVFNFEFNKPMRFDTIKIYLMTGYVMNRIGGVGIKVSAKRSNIETAFMRGSLDKNKEVRYYVPKSTRSILCNVVLLQERLKDLITWIPNPLYMNGKFYDRYIEIPVPSINYITNNFKVNKSDESCPANNIQDIMNISQLSDIEIEFETIAVSNIKEISATSLYGNVNNVSNLGSRYGDIITNPKRRIQYLHDDVIYANVQYSSNSDNFNVRLTVEEDGTLLFYPVYGENPTNSVDVNIAVMNNIENGAITMNDDSYRDALKEDFNPDDFYEMYGDNARQWIIIADLVLNYEYTNIHVPANATLDDIRYKTSETKSYTIDYTNKTLADDAFWRIRYKPSIQDKFGMECRNLLVAVNMHLINRYTGAEIIRTATMRVPNASSFYGANTRKINVDNIYKWKVVNKINKNVVGNVIQQQDNIAPAVLKTYYDSTNLVVKDAGNGNVYTQGQMTLKLYHEAHNYRLTLYNINDSNNRVPYNLTGPFKYYLVFPGADGGKIKITPITDIDVVNMALGELMFKISANTAKNIMNVASKDRYFALISENTIGTVVETSTLYEGKVEWING